MYFKFGMCCMPRYEWTNRKKRRANTRKITRSDWDIRKFSVLRVGWSTIWYVNVAWAPPFHPFIKSFRRGLGDIVVRNGITLQFISILLARNVSNKLQQTTISGCNLKVCTAYVQHEHWHGGVGPWAQVLHA